MKTVKKTMMSLLAVLITICLTAIPASAEGISSYAVQVTHGQTEARSMLAMINEFRTDSEAWYWDSSNTNKVNATCQELTYDYALEQIAQQRAAEIAVSFSHTRPNGESCFTARAGNVRSWGENIAAGQTSAKRVFSSWQETDEDYSGQGHRRNMLSSRFKAVGIGHVVMNGIHYWVQEFGETVSDSAMTAANDGKGEVNVFVKDEDATLSNTVDVSSLTLNVGESASYPSIQTLLTTQEHWGRGVNVQVDWKWSFTKAGILKDNGDGSFQAVKAGETTLTATFGNETLEVPVTVKQSMDKLDCSLEYDTVVYDGTVKEPKVNIEGLTEGIDFNVSYSDNKNAGTASVTVNGIGYCTGKLTKTFQITAASLETKNVSLLNTKFTYDGTEKKPDVFCNGLAEGRDYTVTYTNNINAGTGKAIIKGKGNYTGTVERSFTIAQASLAELEAQFGEFDSHYDGTALQPAVIISGLTEGIDFTVSFSDNVDIGTAIVTVTGVNNYTGTKQMSFEILPMAIEAQEITLGFQKVEYNGTAWTPEVTIAGLVEGTDYLVSYADNINVGIAKVIIEGIGTCSGKVTESFEITPISLNAEIVLSVNTYTYNGKAKKPKVTVEDLTEGVDYKVSYSKNTNVGTAKVTVTGIGNYQGTLSKTFKINPEKTTVTKVTAASKAFTLTWTKKTKQVTGYEIQYATNSKFTSAKKVTITSYKTATKKITKLSAKKKYYVRIRTYKTVNGKKYYSGWSTAKTVTTK